MAFLTGARLQYGNLGFFKDKRYNHAILLYREDTKVAVFATWKKGINNILGETVVLPGMGPGIALGIETDYLFTVNRKEGLHDGQVIAIGTDGVWETRNINGEMFGKERFKALLRHYADRPTAEILNMVFTTLKEFRAGRKADDDITLVLVKVQNRK